MNGEVEQAAVLDERAAAAKGSEEAMERLIEDFKPFLQSRAVRYSMGNSGDRRDELFSTAMIAFYEAVKNYDIEKGHFFQYAERVVRGRLIDFIRSIYRHEGNVVQLEPMLEEGDDKTPSQSAPIIKLSMRSYDEQIRHETIVEEIEQFKSELTTWGITMETLSKNSPKHKKLRETYRQIVAQISNSEDIIQTIQIKRYFPVKAVAEMSGLPQKNVERARTYLIASLIVKLGDYELLSEYVSGGM